MTPACSTSQPSSVLTTALHLPFISLLVVGNDRSDIGTDNHPVGRYQHPSEPSTLSSIAKFLLYSITLLLSALFLRTFYHHFLRLRETNDRKQVQSPNVSRVSLPNLLSSCIRVTRWRNNIPNTNNRLFNVAYAAAVTARKENETCKNLQLRQCTLEEAFPTPSPTRKSFGLDTRHPLTSGKCVFWHAALCHSDSPLLSPGRSWILPHPIPIRSWSRSF